MWRLENVNSWKNYTVIIFVVVSWGFWKRNMKINFWIVSWVRYLQLNQKKIREKFSVNFCIKSRRKLHLSIYARDPRDRKIDWKLWTFSFFTLSHNRIHLTRTNILLCKHNQQLEFIAKFLLVPKLFPPSDDVVVTYKWPNYESLSLFRVLIFRY